MYQTIQESLFNNGSVLYLNKLVQDLKTMNIKNTCGHIKIIN